MKTTKRKRSTKAAQALEAAAVDVVAAQVSSVAEPVVEPTAELSAAAVEALVVEPVVAVAAEVAVEAAAETNAEAVAEPVDPTAETVVAEAVVADTGEPVAAQSLAAETVEPVATETVAVESVTAESVAAEPAPAGEPLVVLAANCSVKDAAALKTSLCAFANESGDVTLDVSAVERVDTATMQLLCAFVRDRSGRKQNVTWRGESQALHDAVRLLGVGALLGFESKGVAA